MPKGPLSLRLYLDLEQLPAGELVCAMVATGEGGEELLARREFLEPATPRESMYAAYLAMLEEALVLQGQGLQVFLAPRFAGIDLDFDPVKSGVSAASPVEIETCRRIRDLSSAFQVVSTSLLGQHEANPAAQFLGQMG